MSAGEPSADQPIRQEPDDSTTLSRRRFLAGVCYATGGLIAAGVAIPAAGMLVGPMLQSVSQVWRAVGTVDQYQVGTTTLVTFENVSPVPWSGQTAQTAAWLRRDDEQTFTAFAANCSHLGCPVRWESNAELFLCPCHGGVYRADGTVAAGPPPKPLYQYPVRINNGQVEIETSALPITT